MIFSLFTFMQKCNKYSLTSTLYCEKKKDKNNNNDKEENYSIINPCDRMKVMCFNVISLGK